MGYEKLRDVIFANQKRLGVEYRRISSLPRGRTDRLRTVAQSCRGGTRFQSCRRNSMRARRRCLRLTRPTPTMRLAG